MHLSICVCSGIFVEVTKVNKFDLNHNSLLKSILVVKRSCNDNFELAFFEQRTLQSSHELLTKFSL